MKHKALHIIIAFLSIVPMGIIAQNADLDKSRYMEGRGKFFRISGNGLSKSSYVLGTMHIVPGEYAETIAGLKDVLANVEQIACERKVSDVVRRKTEFAPTKRDFDSLLVEREKKFMRSDGSQRLVVDELNAKEADEFKWGMNHCRQQ